MATTACEKCGFDPKDKTAERWHTWLHNHAQPFLDEMASEFDKSLSPKVTTKMEALRAMNGFYVMHLDQELFPTKPVEEIFTRVCKRMTEDNDDDEN